LSLPRDELLSGLRERLRQLEEVQRPTRASCSRRLGISAVEDWLPEKGLTAGSLIELFPVADGAGALTLGVFMARHCCDEGQALVVVDQQRVFYPPAAERRGISLDRLIVVRPRTVADAAFALDQALRSTAVGAVMAWPQRLTSTEFRRLQLAAEVGGGLGVLLRPMSAQRTASFAALRLLVAPVASNETVRQVRLEVLRCRGGMPGQAIILEIDDATGDVRVPRRLAAATPDSRAAGVAG
jgi:hypothetical protein